MTDCEQIQDRLAEAGRAALEQDEALRRHVGGCADCSRVLDALARLDVALEDLPAHDASDALVEKTLAAVRRRAGDGGGPRPLGFSGNRTVLAFALAASVVLVAGVGVTRSWLQNQRAPLAVSEAQYRYDDERAARQVAEGLESRGLDNKGDQVHATGNRTSELSGLSGSLVGGQVAGEIVEEEAELAQGKGAKVSSKDLVARLEDRSANERLEREKELVALLRDESGRQDRDAFRGYYEAGREREKKSVSRAKNAEKPPPATETERFNRAFERQIEGNLADGRLGAGEAASREDDLDELAAAPSKQEGRRRELMAKSKPSQEMPAADKEAVVTGPVANGPLSEFAAQAPAAVTAPLPADEPAARPADPGTHRGDDGIALARAEAFLASYATLDGLTFQEPSGYWANGYIPGDPAMRLLRSRLDAWVGSAATPGAGHDQVRRVAQPFDAPRDAAVGLFLQADATSASEPRRLRLQVGLKGAERPGGHRPAMNLALVVDGRLSADPETATRLRALIDALAEARRPGDRFSLSLSGPGGGLVVAPGDFRHGPLSLAMERVFGDGRNVAGEAADLPATMQAAYDTLRAGDDPTAAFGTSLLLLVTDGDLGSQLTEIERAAHRNALAGMPLSVVSLAPAATAETIDRLVAAGQGERRVLAQPAEAQAVIDETLHAASRAVARALRLQIQLAPGVKLVEVIGSQRLEAPQAQVVREAEKAIDRRLARNFGIAADRGEDEPGIQIVIPHFYAGDDHVVLLDVVAEGPGPVAEVTLRYKDLVHLRNGTAQSALALDDSPRAPGALEHNVTKNLLARELSQGFDGVANALVQGKRSAARRLLVELRELIGGMRRIVAAWESDPELLADEALLNGYIAALDRGLYASPVEQRHLAELLAYAAFRKHHAVAE